MTTDTIPNGMQIREPMSVRQSYVSRQATCAFPISRQAEPGQFTTLTLRPALGFPIHTKSQRKLSQSG